MKGLTDDEINLKILRETRLNLLEERDGLRAKIARLTRELDEARNERASLKSVNRYQRGYSDGQKEAAAARAHFRRACEKLAENWNNQVDDEKKSADVIQVEIMVEVNKELRCATSEPKS